MRPAKALSKKIEMYKVESNKSRNLLRISFSKRIEPDEAKVCVEKVKVHLTELKPGFRLLTDLSALESMHVGCVPHLEDSMNACNKSGVSTVVRVIPDPKKDIGFNILSLFHYRRRIRIVTCETLAEAMKILDE